MSKGERRALHHAVWDDGAATAGAPRQRRRLLPRAVAEEQARSVERQPGIATCGNVRSQQRRTYICDPSQHRVHIVGADGRLIASFGAKGSRPGEFDTPLDVALVRVPFAGEDLDDGDLDGALVAVADCGNDRVQLFEPDGVPFGVVSGRLDDASDLRRRSGHRLFRIDAHPFLVAPRRLSSNGSVIEAQCAERAVLVDLTHALLLDYVMWAESPAVAAHRVSEWLL
jgi:hypothetical protein